MVKGLSKDGGSSLAHLPEEDGKEYFFPDGSKSKYPFEENPLLRTIDGDTSVSSM